MEEKEKVKKTKKKVKEVVRETKKEEIMETAIVEVVPEVIKEVVEESKPTETNVLPFKRVQVDTLAERKAEVARLKAEYDAAVKEEKEREEAERAKNAPLIERLTRQIEEIKGDIEISKNLVRIATESFNGIKAKLEEITGKPVKRKKAS